MNGKTHVGTRFLSPDGGRTEGIKPQTLKSLWGGTEEAAFLSLQNPSPYTDIAERKSNTFLSFH